MAKVLRPLQSGSASGQIGKAAVHFDWKGIHAVRSYVIPANPKTTAQVSVRTKFRDCITNWHNPAMNALDKEAWKKFVELVKRPMTGMNAYVSERMKVVTAGQVWTNVWTYTVLFVSSGGLKFAVVSASDMGLKCSVGTSLTYRPYIFDGVWNSTNSRWDFTITGMPVSTRIFMHIYASIVGKYGKTGIYVGETGA